MAVSSSDELVRGEEEAMLLEGKNDSEQKGFGWDLGVKQMGSGVLGWELKWY